MDPTNKELFKAVIDGTKAQSVKKVNNLVDTILQMPSNFVMIGYKEEFVSIHGAVSFFSGTFTTRN